MTNPTPRPGRNARRRARTAHRIAQAREEGRLHGLRQAHRPGDARARQLEAEIESMLTIEEGNRTAWSAKCERVRELEAENARLRAHVRDAEDYLRLTHTYPATGGGHDTLGAGFSCDGCQLAKKLKAALTAEEADRG